MAYGSTIVIAEAKLQPSGIVWRVASGSGWGALGGERTLLGGAFVTEAGGDYTDRAIDDCAACLRGLASKLVLMADWADRTQSLPVGSMGELHRSSKGRA